VSDLPDFKVPPMRPHAVRILVDGETIWARSAEPRSVEEREAEEREFRAMVYGRRREALDRLLDPGPPEFVTYVDGLRRRPVS